MFVLLLLGFLLMGLFALYVISLRPMWLVFNSRDWQETPCEVVSSQVSVHKDSYSVNIAYTYTADEQQHVGPRFSFDGSRSSSRAASEVIVTEHPVGFRGVCFVDPGDRGSSVMRRSTGGSAVWGLLTLPFIVIGAGGFYLYVVAKRSKDSVPLTIDEPADSDFSNGDRQDRA
jgi:hypothetical protein